MVGNVIQRLEITCRKLSSGAILGYDFIDTNANWVSLEQTTLPTETYLLVYTRAMNRVIIAIYTCKMPLHWSVHPSWGPPYWEYRYRSNFSRFNDFMDTCPLSPYSVAVAPLHSHALGSGRHDQRGTFE